MGTVGVEIPCTGLIGELLCHYMTGKFWIGRLVYMGEGVTGEMDQAFVDMLHFGCCTLRFYAILLLDKVRKDDVYGLYSSDYIYRGITIEHVNLSNNNFETFRNENEVFDSLNKVIYLLEYYAGHTK